MPDHVAKQVLSIAVQRFELTVLFAENIRHWFNLRAQERLQPQQVHNLNLCRPSRKITTLPFGIFTVLCTLAKVPTLCRSAAAGSSTRGSCWATTPKTLSSPCNELISASELSRPTVSGRTAPGNSTVSLTGRIGN